MLRGSSAGLLLSSATLSPAWADEPAQTEPEAEGTTEVPSSDAATEEAHNLFVSGRTAWSEQRYDDACELFHRSQELKASAAALLNLGRCHEMHDDEDAARESYRGALALAESEQDETKRNLWRSAAFEALERLGPEEPEEDPIVAPVAPLPKQDPQPAPQAAVEETPRKSFLRQPATPWIFMGTGAALILSSVGTGIVSLNANAKLEEECDQDMSCRPGLETTKNRAKNTAIATDVLWISGAVLTSAGVVLYLTRPDDAGSRVGLGCGQFGCGATVGGRF